MKLHYNHLFILLLGALLFSCTTDEFQPDPIGEQVSFEPEQLPTLQEELESSGHSLFLAAWNRSTLSDSLSAWESVPLTILVPSDVAFENAGYTSEFINNARVSLLDSILLYHCLEVNLDTIANTQTFGNIKIKTKLVDPVIKEGANTSLIPYTYAHYIGVSGGRLFVNGKNTESFSLMKRVQKAELLYTGHLFAKPEKDIWTFLKEDERFSIFVNIIESSDNIYSTRMPDAVMQKWLAVDSTSTSQMIRFISIFAPTDEAFEKAGYTASSLRRLNLINQSKINTPIYQPYAYNAFLKSDSIISWHSWGMRYFPASSVKPNPTVFSSNELTDDFLGDYILQPLGWKPIEQPIMYVPFNFSKDEQGRVTVRLKTAAEDAEPATIIESDIMTLNGPIHIVDRLFIPKDF